MSSWFVISAGICFFIYFGKKDAIGMGTSRGAEECRESFSFVAPARRYKRPKKFDRNALL